MAERTTNSAADEYGTGQAPSLANQERITENFQDKADTTYSAQRETMNQSDTERAEGTDKGSKMISGDASRHNMNPPEDMRREVDSAAFDERLIQDGLTDKFNEKKDDLYKEGKSSDFNRDSFIDDLDKPQKFDNKYENTSDYENDM